MDASPEVPMDERERGSRATPGRAGRNRDRAARVLGRCLVLAALAPALVPVLANAQAPPPPATTDPGAAPATDATAPQPPAPAAPATTTVNAPTLPALPSLPSLPSLPAPPTPTPAVSGASPYASGGGGAAPASPAAPATPATPSSPGSPGSGSPSQPPPPSSPARTPGGPYAVRQTEHAGSEVLSGNVCDLAADFRVHFAARTIAFDVSFAPAAAVRGQPAHPSGTWAYAYVIPRAGETHRAKGDYDARVDATSGVVHVTMIHGGDFVTFHGFAGTMHTDYGFDLVPAPGATCAATP
jgi:hypothetical protein